MQITVPLAGKRRLLLLLGIGFGIALLVVIGALMLRREPTLDEKRNANLDALAKMLEGYYAQHGFYPQPAAREETIDGVRHVWGYRAKEPALASCTIHQSPEGPDALQSFCGGNVYDARGNVIGWKGTLALTSALNSVEVANSDGGRLISPLSDFQPELSLDPAYLPFPALTTAGFGEYIYAVRAPEDGAEGKGGVQYQLAATISDPATGKLHTAVRGNYFVRSDEQDELPPSLLGPGILFDTHGNPELSAPLHVLLEGQQEGYPNPLLGEGESILAFLTLRGRTARIREELQSRITLLASFPEAASTENAKKTLEDLLKRTDVLLLELPQVGVKEDIDITKVESEVSEISVLLQESFATFITEKANEVKTILLAEVHQGEAMRSILSGALLRVGVTEELILLARDELLKYLDGEGIEEQSRDRAGRRIESALDGIPDLSSLFEAQKLPFPQPFLSEELQESVSALTGSGASAGISDPTPMITSIASELSLLFSELQGILEDIQNDLANPVSEIGDIDEALRRLGRALSTERERVTGLFLDLSSKETASEILADFETSLSTPGNEAQAIRAAAARSGEHGDFAPLLFSPEALDALVLQKQVGVPDAEYKGIPYPLP
jgi:hypothetical protein